jgi:hypothetical protein
MQEIVLEQLEGLLIGRIYVDKVKTSAYINLEPGNEYLFTKDQLNKINSQVF